MFSNILFSALVGFAVIVNPLADFYTKYYIAVISMLWANTFSLLILFFPKIQAFYQYKLKEKRKRESEEKREQKSIFSFLQPDESTGAGELMNLEQILAVDGPVTGQRKPSAVSTASTATDGCKFIEVHEGEMPIRKVFRYFPYLSQWEMHHVMVFPWLGYFSHYSVSTLGHSFSAVAHFFFIYRKMQRKEWSCLILKQPCILLD